MNPRELRLTLARTVVTLVMLGQSTGNAEQVERAGGDTTVWDDKPTAYGRALANLDPARWQEMLAGKRRFVTPWPEQGPWSDASACSDCHYRDGRGPRAHTPTLDLAHILRLGDASSGRADPTYGVQLRRVGHGTTAPGAFAVEWVEKSGRYSSGEPYRLRRPVVQIQALAYGRFHPLTRVSLRVPPATFGLGLLEAVTEDEIVKAADPDDRDGDGISGSVQRVQDVMSGRRHVGRFGWKAARPSLAAQATAALAEDIGVRGPFATVDSLVGYLRTLAPPGRRDTANPLVIEGQTLFTTVGCAACHRPRFTTGDLSGWPELSRQSVYAYTDLLLHDMGAELADEIAEERASGREWRTPPLWGLGVLQIVSGNVRLMHDGRARDPEEAILWHGGEAARARDRFAGLPPDKRAALLKFLASL